MCSDAFNVDVTPGIWHALSPSRNQPHEIWRDCREGVAIVLLLLLMHQLFPRNHSPASQSLRQAGQRVRQDTCVCCVYSFFVQETVLQGFRGGRLRLSGCTQRLAEDLLSSLRADPSVLLTAEAEAAPGELVQVAGGSTSVSLQVSSGLRFCWIFAGTPKGLRLPSFRHRHPRLCALLCSRGRYSERRNWLRLQWPLVSDLCLASGKHVF